MTTYEKLQYAKRISDRICNRVMNNSTLLDDTALLAVHTRLTALVIHLGNKDHRELVEQEQKHARL